MSILREELITNHLLLDYFELWDEFDIKSANDTREVRYYNLLMNLINGQLDAGIRWLDSDEAKEYFTGETEYQKEVFQALEDEWDTILQGKYNNVEALLSEVYRRGKAKGYADMREHIKYTEQDKLALHFGIDYNFNLIQKIDDDIRYKIKNKIIESIISGEHPYNVAPKILNVVQEKFDGSNFTPKQRATMIARTEVSRVQNTGILQSYVNEGYTEVKILTAEDGHVCDLCLKYAFEFNKDEDITFENRGKEKVHNILKLIKGGLYPPFHPLCRCTYLSVWNSKGEPSSNNYVVCLVNNELNANNYLAPVSKHTAIEYNELLRKNSVKCSYVENNINSNTSLFDDECFFKYEFENGVVIYKSCEGTTVSVNDIYEQYMDLPKKFRESATEIVLSTHHFYNPITNELIEGFVAPDDFNRVHILTDKYCSFSKEKANEILVHELAHCFEGESRKYSSTNEYHDIFCEDYTKLKNKRFPHGRKKYSESQRFVTNYSFRASKRFYNENNKKFENLSEDFAESVMKYFLHESDLEERFKSKWEYLNNIFGNNIK